MGKEDRERKTESKKNEQYNPPSFPLDLLYFSKGEKLVSKVDGRAHCLTQVLDPNSLQGLGFISC